MLHSLIIILPMLVCWFWLAGLLGAWRSSYPGKRILGLFFGATAVLYTCHWLYFSGIRSPWLETLYGAMNLSVYPLFLIYLTALHHTSLRTAHLPLLTLIPAGIIAIAYPVCFICGWEEAQHYFYLFARVCFMLQVFYVWFAGSRVIRSLVNRLDDFFTDDRSAQLQTLRVLLWLFGCTALFSAVWNLLGRERFADTEWVALPSVLMSGLLYALGYAGFVLPDPVKGLEESSDREPEKPLPPQSDEADVILAKLEEKMRDEKIYLRSDLTITDACALVGTNRSYISAAINRAYGINFSTYINRLRIAEAKRLLLSPDHPSDKAAIADTIAQCGFNNTQTFYRVFKEQTGMTPLQWRSSSRH